MKKKWQINGVDVEMELLKSSNDQVVLKIADEIFEFSLGDQTLNKLTLQNGSEFNSLSYVLDHKQMYISLGGESFNVSAAQIRKQKNDSNMEEMLSPMPGKVLKYFVKVGDEVSAGDPLLILEAMKMEHTIKCAHPGRIEKLLYNPGDIVDGGVELVEMTYAKKTTKAD